MEDFTKLLAGSLSNDNATRKSAENTIENITIDSNLLELIFNYLAKRDIDISLRKAAAILLMKNIKNFWYDDTEIAIEKPHKVISQETKQLFTENILNLMVSVDPRLAPIVKEMIVTICKQAGGYINAWPSIMNMFNKILATKNSQVSVDIYHLINKIIKRYRIEFKSYPLFEEIKNTIKEIAPQMTEDMGSALNFLYETSQNTEQTVMNLQMIKHIPNIFYSMNYQDFPEFFEDHLESWMNLLKGALELNIKLEDPNILHLFIKTKSVAMKCLNLYCNNYYEDFMRYHDNFLPVIWKLVLTIKEEEAYLKLTRELLDYYKILFQYKRTKNIDQSSVQMLINNLVIPNMKMTGKEIDDFDDNPINFLKIELEEADMDSNKYHAINLLKNLLNHYPSITSEFIRPLINQQLENYYSNPRKNWMDKVVAINLIFATMIKTFAQRIGVTELKTNLEEISSLIELILLKEFQEVKQPHIIARVYSMKFLTTFRLQIPQSWHGSIIKMLVDILSMEDKVMEAACLLSLEKILFMKDLNSNEALVKGAVNDESIFGDLVGSLVKIVSKDINTFAMRCLFRTIYLTHESYFKPIISSLSSSMNGILKLVIANSTEDQFNYFLFETIALILRKLISTDLSLYNEFKSAISENLLMIIQNGVTDLMAYAFQIYALQLSNSGEENKPDSIHENLLSSIIYSESNWVVQMKYMFNPFVQYLKVAFMKNKPYFTDQVINDMFKNIIHRLLALKNYSLCFELLDLILNFFDLGTVYTNLGQTFRIFLEVYNNCKTNNKKAFNEFSKILVVFAAKVVVKGSSKALIDMIEGISSGSTVSLLTELVNYLIDLEYKNKKLVNFAFCKLIGDYCTSFDQQTLVHFGVNLAKTLEKFHKMSLSSLGGKFMDSNDDLIYNANSYNKLTNADIKVTFSDYEKIYQMDENQIFVTTMMAVKNSTNFDLLKEIYDKLTDKEKDFVQNASKNYFR